MSLKKTVKRANAHAVFCTRDGQWQWHILKTYALPAKEKDNPYARWFCDVVSPIVGESGEMGDTYISDVKQYGHLVRASAEWIAAYGITNPGQQNILVT
jgi:hypothetical protein